MTTQVCEASLIRRPVLTPRQLRAARVLIGWSRKVLSERSGVPIKTTEAFERGTTDPKIVHRAQVAPCA